ncbi:MAG: hypothetical protein ACRDIE_01895 [Chloroflexota bacterium]
MNALLRQHAQAGTTRPGEGAPVQRRARSASGSGPVPVQRWPTNTPTLDWSQTQTITALQSGQPVLFFHDTTEPPVVVKAEDAPYGLTLLNAFMQKKVHGTPTVTTRDGSADKGTLVNLIMDAGKSDDSWEKLGNAKDGNSWIVPRNEYDPGDPTMRAMRPTKGTSPAEKARYFMAKQFQAKPKIQIMAVAEGKSARKMAHKDAAATDVKPSRIRQLFDDDAYVTRLGQLTAADLFVENEDRVLANYGNWMTNANNAITLIDNMDANAQALWGKDDVIGRKQSIDRLAPSKRAKLATDLVKWLAKEVRAGIKGGDAGINAWLQEQGTAGTREQTIKQQLIQGLDLGCARIIKLYATNKTGKEGRQAKKAAKLAYKMDIKAGDKQKGGVSYWERLKARARYLQALT